MKQILLSCYFLLLVFVSVSGQNDSTPYELKWGELTEIPPAPGKNVQPGLAGAFIGLHNNALIIAGGANFPDGPAWEGGQKVYHKSIYILEKEGSAYGWYDERRFSLPREIAYGLTISTDRGLVCLGGMDQDHSYDEVFSLHWDEQEKEITIENWPALPVPVANISGGQIGGKIYVAASANQGGQKYFWSLDLNNPVEWQSLPTWDGAARTHALGVVQNNGEEDCFYLMKGRYQGQDGISTLFKDVHVYRPSSNSWEAIETTQIAEADFKTAAGTAVASGANHILLFGGDSGEIFNTLEQFAVDIAAEKDSFLQGQLMQARDAIMMQHPGFSRAIYAFHTITQTWTKVGVFPSGSQVTTTALIWDGQMIIPTGEIAPCIRTPRILAGDFVNTPRFGTLNYMVLGGYLFLLIGLGFYFSKNQKTTDDFFKGGNRIPWWAAGLSIFGTQLSAITFMAIPAKTFATNWQYFVMSMTIIMVAPFIIRYFLPYFRRFNLTSAYEYLEARFNLTARLLGSLMYTLLQLGRVGIVLLLPSLALAVVTGIDVYLCILTMGGLSILYTVLGGIEAVIWTDVLQVIVLLGGALLSLIVLLLDLDTQDITTYIHRFDKMQVFDFTWSFSEPTLWVVLLGGLAANIVSYGSDQTVIQRYLTTKDEQSAKKSIMTGAWMTVPATLIFFTLGTLLFVYYKVQPEGLNPSLTNTDSIFPWYIINSLPNGVSGLLIAAVFAASMSSLDSAMNSVSTVITTDFFRRLRPLKNEASYLRVARWITVIIGVLGTLIALYMAGAGISSLWDQFNMIIGLFAGGLGGIFLLGIFVKRANGTGAIIALVASGIVQYLVKEFTDIHLLLYAFTGMVSAVIIGYLSSLLFGGEAKEVNN